MKIKAPAHGTCIAYLALFMAMTGTAAAATGGTFVLGRSNASSTQTLLTNTGTGPVLALSTKTGQPPIAVSSSAGKATNLSADKLDGLDSTQLQRRVTATCSAGQAVTAISAAGGVTCANTGGNAPAPAPAQSTDKGFAISDLQLKADAASQWSGVARITNQNTASKTATFTITVFRNNSIVATLRGSVSDLAAGATNTVDFSSTETFTTGDFTTTFQTDSTF